MAPYLPVEASRLQADAAQKELERRRAARFPTLSVSGFLFPEMTEKPYNTDSHIYRSYSTAALVLKFPLFDRSLTTDEAVARVQWEKAKKQLAQTQIDMAALSDTLGEKIPVIEKSIDLARKSIANRQTLLAVAQVSIAIVEWNRP